jgi:membrane fusion protein (multidrug efflux system)
VPVESSYVAQTFGSEEVRVEARVEGILLGSDFSEGSRVAKGQLLFTIDPRQNQATLDGARSRLAQARADLARVEQDVARFEPLVAENALPRQSLETARAQAAAARANVEAAQATVATAELNLGYTRVYAPIDGIVGKSEVSAGNLVGRGQATLLTTISKIDPINARFSLSEREYLRLARLFVGHREAGTPQPPGGSGELRLVLADGTEHPHAGKLSFVDRLVDPTTGTLLVQAQFPNPERIVRPGQFGRVQVVLDVLKDAILVPQTAVQELQGTFSVAVVGADNTVAMRAVQMGPRVGTLWVVTQGLAGADRVIVEGLQKVRQGVTVAPTVVKIDEAAPAPRPAAGA